MFSLGPGNDLARGDAPTPEGSGLWTAQRRRPKASPGPPPPSSAAWLPSTTPPPQAQQRQPESPGGLWKPSTLRKDRQEANIYRDVGVSGCAGTNSRAGWRALNAQLVSGDILVVVAIDPIGRRWMDTVNAVRDLRAREVRIRSLAQSEATWVTCLASEPDTAEAVIGDILTTFMAWAAEALRQITMGPHQDEPEDPGTAAAWGDSARPDGSLTITSFPALNTGSRASSRLGPETGVTSTATAGTPWAVGVGVLCR